MRRPWLPCGVVLCALLPSCKPKEQIPWNSYRLGDYFYGYGRYVDKANKLDLNGTIIEEYRSLATSVMDLYALETAAEDVCQTISQQAPRLPRLPRSQYAAVHLRLGDVLDSHKYEFDKYTPAVLYEVAAAELVKAGTTAVELYYDANWGMVKSKQNLQNRQQKKTAKYIETVTSIFKKAGILSVQKAPNLNADQDLCAMLEAPIFLAAGGGYSRLIRQVRAHMGDTLSPTPQWWCDWPWPRFINKTVLPYSQPVKDLYGTAVQRCGPYDRWQRKTEYWQTLSQRQAGVKPYNWTETEENRTLTVFEPKDKANWTKKQRARPPVDSNGLEVRGKPPDWNPDWNASLCCKLPDVSEDMPVPLPKDVCTTCVNHDHFCSQNRWQCETHCKMQFCESGKISEKLYRIFRPKKT